MRVNTPTKALCPELPCVSPLASTEPGWDGRDLSKIASPEFEMGSRQCDPEAEGPEEGNPARYGTDSSITFVGPDVGIAFVQKLAQSRKHACH
jgi:hypothetical protein